MNDRRDPTVRKRIAAASVVGALALVSGGAEAQSWGRPHAPQSGACFYRDADFRGDYFCANGGGAFSSLPPGMNDQVSSIRMFGNAAVTLFQNERFRGRSRDFVGDVRNLREEHWNDRISSVRVAKTFWRGGHYSGSPDAIIRRAYADILERQPDPEGLHLYRKRMVEEGWSEHQVREALRDSPEYQTRFR